MASGIFAILDDIAALMDDVAIASKVAVKKTAGILGDDLAVNAEKATGFLSSREIPVLWAITKGSLLNKIIIVPIAILLNLYFPAAINWILLLGGLYLAYEGVEKIIEYLFHKKVSTTGDTEEIQDINDSAAEKLKIKSAITTDFILSIEIVILALNAVLESNIKVQVLTVSVVAILATVGVYGIVALIVRMDDAGFRLIKASDGIGMIAKVGRMLVNGLPYVIKSLSIVGTVALLLVSGGIFEHNIDYFHSVLPGLPSVLKQLLLGLLIGTIVVLVMNLFKKIIPFK